MSGLDPGTVVAGSGGGAAGTVSSTVGLLHNKVDKMVRLMVETSENQKKMNKVLQDLLKSGFIKSEPNIVNNDFQILKQHQQETWRLQFTKMFNRVPKDVLRSVIILIMSPPCSYL